MMKSDAFMREVERTGGTHCPCCGQFAKIYRRRLNCQAAFGMVRLAAMGSAESFNTYQHVSKIMSGYGGRTGGGDFAKAALWNLIEQMPNDAPERHTSGKWRLTQEGILFATNQIRIREYVNIYNGEVLNYSGGYVGIKDALHAQFNYAELL